MYFNKFWKFNNEQPIISVTNGETEPKEKEISPVHSINEEKDEKHLNEKEVIDPKNITEDQLEKFLYEKAIQYEHQNFGKTYIYLILHKQSILSEIFIKTVSKLTCLKITTIIVVFTLNIGWNAFFFSQSMQNRRFKGDTSIWIRIPKVILSCFSSIICCFIINLVSSYENDLNKLKK